MKFLHLLAVLLLASPVATPLLAQENPTPEPPNNAKSGNAKSGETYDFPEEGDPLQVVEFEELKKIVKNHDSELLVVNFWATWCAPCVAELPHFAEADGEFREKGVRFVGLTLDNLTYDDWPEVAAKTMSERGVKYANFGLNADPNVFVPWFAEEWVGAIPATFYFDKDGNKLGQRLRDVTREELHADIEKYLPKAKETTAEAEDQSSSNTEKS